jgi:predicted Zn-dependent peptidase
MIRVRANKFHLGLFLSLSLIASIAGAYNLDEIKTEKLANGLTVMVLEDHTQPLVSTQMFYRVGSRNECVGTTGLAHFVEHMAFRATKHFPNSEVVSKIYAVGGEWHGYTWIDQTTYFETVPLKDLDLVLQIQADRMNEVVNNSEELEAERGAVLTELHSYENDPSSLLNDAVVAASFEEHPYRYNVIGWTSDVEKITHDDLVRFYKRYYNPSNAVFAIAGDVRASDVLDRVRKYFSPIPSGSKAESPRTVEPPQNGERRVQLRGTGPFNYFQISYRAPAAREPDYPNFLLLQGLLTGSGGVNFRQRGSGESPRSGTRLFGLPFRVSTFLIPTADPYVFSFTGRVPPTMNTVEIEQTL